MDNYTVYMHVTPNNKKYIGITSRTPELRWGKNGIGYKHNKLFNRAILKYGWNNIKHEILFENLTQEEAMKKEIELISFYDTTNRNKGYNISLGGGYTTKGYKFTKEQRKRTSIAKTIPIYCIEENKIYKSLIELKNVGYGNAYKVCRGERKTCKGKHFAFLKDKIKINLDELVPPPGKKVICLETKEIFSTISQAAIAKNCSRNSISSCCANKLKSTSGLHWQYYNDNFNLKDCEKLIKIKTTPIKKLKKVICIETGVIYNCIAKASKETNISHISECCYNKRKTAGGYHWEFCIQKEVVKCEK